MRRTLLIDADIVAFKYSAATEKVFYFNDEPSVMDDFESAKEGARRDIEDLQEQLGADDVIVCLTDPDKNFRKDVYPLYKHNRSGTRKPVNLMPLKEWFKEVFKTYQRPTLEADDCMGILSTHKSLVEGEKIIVSEDKDMQTIPGLLFNPRKDEKPRRITKLAADCYHLYQTITGDTTDGYPGCKGVGKASVEAKGVLASKTVDEAWDWVLKAYRRKGRSEEDAIVQARCARILRASDWDFKAKRPILWSPPRVRT